MSDDIIITVADETSQDITIAGDITVTVSEGSQIKDTHISEKFTNQVGANQVLTLGNTFRLGSCRVFLNGILMEKDVDYTEAVNRGSLTILNTLVATDKIEVIYVIN
jgi:hypothetical protein